MLFSSAKEEELEISSQFEKKGVLYYEVKLINRGIICKGCGTYHTNVKEYIHKKIVHSIYYGKPCTILFKHRRFLCPKCGKTAMDRNPFCSESCRISDQTILNILSFLKRYNNPFRAAAEYFRVAVSEVIRIFDRYCQMDRNPFTKVMCFDEVYFSRKRKKKYVLVIINFFNRAIIDVLKDRDKRTIASYLKGIDLKERNRVEYACIDMNDSYREVLPRYLHNATIVADSFHVVKRVGKALDEVRKKVMRRYESDKKSDGYYLLKYREEILFGDSLSDKPVYNRHFHLPLSEFELMRKMKELDKELADAYDLYQAYLSFNNTDYMDSLKALNDLEEYINSCKVSGIKEFIDLSNTLSNWKTEIINSFCKLKGQRVSNGPIEGRNSLIKKILKIANGYSNFDRFRNRIIYSLNKFATHSFRPD
ncbi:MAG: ISL3 family transposase [Erysipelotrichaceae bacterium]|nr:ISL3 family transposase [Erysipelotrichaceae bacterium]